MCVHCLVHVRASDIVFAAEVNQAVLELAIYEQMARRPNNKMGQFHIQLTDQANSSLLPRCSADTILH